MRRERSYLLIVLLVWGLAFLWSLSFSDPWFRPYDRLWRAEVGTFEPLQRIESEEIGDLGYKTWIRELQQPRTTVFSTDEFGWRNPPGLGDPEIVLLCDSYCTGAGLSDDETPAQRLTHLLKRPTASYGGPPARFLAEERYVKNPPKVVVYAPTSRALRARGLAFARPPEPPKTISSEWIRLGAEVQRKVRRLNEDNRLVREMRFQLQRLWFERFGHPDLVKTPEGQDALVLPLSAQELFKSPQARGAKDIIEMMMQFQWFLAKRGTRLIFAPIPESGTIYPEIFPPEDRARVHSPSLFDVLLRELPKHGITVLDLRKTFQENRSPYLYRLDDTHWTPRAAALASRSLADTIEPILGSPLVVTGTVTGERKEDPLPASDFGP